MNTVEIYTDGACKGNPGPGGWGALLRSPTGQEKELFGGELETTNNRMELMAVIQALRALKRPCVVALYLDSEYVRKGITEWIHGWKARNWRTAAKQPVKNADLWQQLDALTHQGDHDIVWHWVKGHAGHVDNNVRMVWLTEVWNWPCRVGDSLCEAVVKVSHLADGAEP